MQIQDPTSIIIGGGLGGLGLAQGLKKAGLNVEVYERDRTPTDREQGYRIHIDPQGSRALHACLPEARFERFVATSGPAGKGFCILDEQYRELVVFGALDAATEADPIARHKSVSRITLRQILLEGLEDDVHFGKRFTHYEETPEGRIKACFEDGSTATGEVLIGADGGNSAVRRQFLPNAQRIETGVVGIMGKVPLDQKTRGLLPSGRFDVAGLLLGPKGCASFLAVHDFHPEPGEASQLKGVADPSQTEDSGLLFDNTRGYILWGFLAHRKSYPIDPMVLDGPALRDVTLRRTARWHPDLRELIQGTDPATILATSLRTSVPVEPWESKHVTLLGDAIHSMTPLQGMGGNTALRDAQLLCKNLTSAHRGEVSLLQAIQAYEAEMRRYGFEAVRRSQQTLNLVVLENSLGRGLLKSAFRALDVAFSWKRRVAS